MKPLGLAAKCKIINAVAMAQLQDNHYVGFRAAQPCFPALPAAD